MVELSRDTLIVFVSDSHIGGDPGCDGFESPEELEALFEELAGSKGPIELVLAGDLFDFLQISTTNSGLDRAAATVSRPEYVGMFEALRRFNEQEQKRVIYLPGNHDAEMWWNPEIQKTLRERGLVDEFALSYLASIEAGGERRTIILRAWQPIRSRKHDRGLRRSPRHSARTPRGYGFHPARCALWGGGAGAGPLGGEKRLPARGDTTLDREPLLLRCRGACDGLSALATPGGLCRLSGGCIHAGYRERDPE